MIVAAIVAIMLRCRREGCEDRSARRQRSVALRVEPGKDMSTTEPPARCGARVGLSTGERLAPWERSS